MSFKVGAPAPPLPSSSSSSSSSTCQTETSSETPIPFFVVAGVGIAITAAYVIHKVRKNNYLRPVPLHDPDDSPSAACALARAWLAADPDPETKAEVQAWLSAHLASKCGSASSTGTGSNSASTASTSSFVPRPLLLDALDPSAASNRLFFGTAGVRAAVGAGYDRLNALTVIAVAQAVAQTVSPRGEVVSIGHDARHSSRKFALLVAQVFHHAGASVRMFSRPVPTPLVAFDALNNHAKCALVVTASHNPPQDNGIKVYDADGIQLRPEMAHRIEARMQQRASSKPLRAYEITETSSLTKLFIDPLATARKAYINKVQSIIQWRSKDENGRAPRAVYTACHGVGYDYIGELFSTLGLPAVIPCEAQVEPDGDFPTLAFPNPEERGALDLALQTARTHGASLVLANDPDADRFAAAELASDGMARVFTGDELAALFVDWMTSRLVERHGSGHDMSRYAVVTSTVSSKLLASMARQRGFTFHESMTGFKWLNKTAVDLERNVGKTVLLTYEEAIGFNVTRNVVRDKDGVSAAAMFYEMAAWIYASKTTLVDRLREIIDECGVHVSNNGFFRLSSQSPTTKAIFDAARKAGLPSRIGDMYVMSYRDLTNGVDTAEPQKKSSFPADASSQFLTFRCSKDPSNMDNPPMIIHLRGSGTGKFIHSQNRAPLSFLSLP